MSFWSPRSHNLKQKLSFELHWPLQDPSPDILLTDTNLHGMLGLLILKSNTELDKISLVCYAKGDNQLSMETHFNPIIRYLVRKLRKAIYKKANLVIYASNWLKHTIEEDIPSLKGKPNCIVRTGVSTFYLNRPYVERNWNTDQTLKLLYAGTLNLQPKASRLERLAQITEELNRHGHSTHLRILGGGKLLNETRNRLKVYADTTIEGYVSSEALVLAYEDSHIFVYDSESDGAPNTIMEAQACGLPVITTDTSGAPELISNKTGFACNTYEEMLSAIILLKENTTKLKNMSLNAYKYARENLTWENSAKQLVEALKLLKV